MSPGRTPTFSSDSDDSETGINSLLEEAVEEMHRFGPDDASYGTLRRAPVFLNVDGESETSTVLDPEPSSSISPSVSLDPKIFIEQALISLAKMANDPHIDRVALAQVQGNLTQAMKQLHRSKEDTSSE
jgi:hypothetical protein